MTFTAMKKLNVGLGTNPELVRLDATSGGHHVDIGFGHLHRGFHRLLHRSHLVAEGERAQRPPRLTNYYFGAA
jgi:hypothetical protein